MKASFIVSAFDRPDALACCLYSLKIQTEPDFEVLVTDNGTDGDLAHANRRITSWTIGDTRFRYEQTEMRDCYESANYGSAMAGGEYLCFPSDDGYYAPRFLELMLKHGAGADVIYCDCVYDGHGYACTLLDVAPMLNRIDKGGFLVRRRLFTGFGGEFGVNRAADGLMVEALVRKGASHRKVPIVGWVHN